MRKCYMDLHTHTTRSDGALTPGELIDRAREAGIGILAITDHNYTEDLTALREANPDMTLIQGAEISCLYDAPSGREVELHVVGLGFDRDNERIRQVLAHNQPDRRPYVNAILDRLRECGIDLGDYEAIRQGAPDSKHLGRMQIAKTMVAKGYVSSVESAFEEYLGAFGKRRAFVVNPLRFVGLSEAVEAILAAGGIPVLCHLFYYQLEEGDQEALLRRFQELAGEKGAIEVYYSKYDQAGRQFLLEKSRAYRLMSSAASDFHGQDPMDRMDHYFSPEDCGALLDVLGVRG